MTPNQSKEGEMAAPKKCKPCNCPKGLPMWLGTFGDLMSLLLTFFVLLLSMATFETKKVDAAIGSLQGALGVLEEGRETEITPPEPIKATPIKKDSDADNAMNLLSSLITEFNELDKMGRGPAIKLEESEDGFRVEIPSDLLFASGSDEITNKDGKLFLQRVATAFAKMPKSMELDVIGHTDTTPIRGGKYSDNWELSLGRSLSVSSLIKQDSGIKDRVKSSGRGETKPVASNETDDGKALNRRVELYFYSLDQEDKEKAKSAME